MKPAPERAQLTRLPFGALAAVAKVIESGDRKYREGDWIDAPDRIDGRRDLDSALAHVAEWLAGKDVDEESGESPLAHAAARLLFILERRARGWNAGMWRAHPVIKTAPVVGTNVAQPALCSCLTFRGARVTWCDLLMGHTGPHSFELTCSNAESGTFPDAGEPT